ncbi:HEPN domain-containing protein [Pseudidiomarina terrestris]|uniref:HEPN domain-containing protein n=1 Tax=Pseudidiomarina terrestris TaxID=2820060 RepID=UPI00264DB301|nr:HEPN domain-containing protein [Pseudidiomarina sp. 1ASP75-5]MDN7135220.1 hypothetical protein [Pseudidiomarina sp. 1ASP75-5]
MSKKRLSGRFIELRKRLRELRRHLLPAKFSTTGDYTDRQLDRVRGYRLLVHAEIEAYIEDVAKETVINAIQRWKNNGKPSVVIVSFLASYHSSWAVNDELKQHEIIQLANNRHSGPKAVAAIIDLAQTQFVNKLKDNHGIKEKNIKTLIIPTGIDVDSLDTTWLTNLDDYGTKRGDVAHKAKRAQKSINPKDEYETVKSLLSGLEDLDIQIMKLP